ncbi:MAG: restriction endonuclease subunit S [Patescibacteria group bacterium]|nr:restriction endonuclease subunit S [Patescibacteria group bacterium]
MDYVDIPQTVKITDLFNKRAVFSPHNYKQIILGTTNHKKVRDFLTKKPIKGIEVGSDAYITQSNKYFIRTKAIQEEIFILNDTPEGIIPILPEKFKNYSLKSGDILISKDSNIGEAIILEKDYPSHMMSAGIYKLPVEKEKYYLFAFLKHPFFKQQLNFLVSRGATIKHAKTLFLDCFIPLPKQKNANDVISFIEIITESIIEKEKLIIKREEEIFKKIDDELKNNQKKDFVYELPKIKDIKQTSRIDGAFYCKDYKEKQGMILNYSHGYGTVQEWGYKDPTRGQNLQISAIGQSIYTYEKKDNFYTLVRPTNISDFGTVARFEYLGNPKKLLAIKKGDIIFSAEGSIGKCIMFADPSERLLTNIHGIVLNKKDHNETESAFVASFLRYLRHKGVLDYISVGGQGGSLASKYWNEIKIPFFPKPKIKEIALLYYCGDSIKLNKLSISNFVAQNEYLNKTSSILGLDKQIKTLKNQLKILLDRIINGQEVKIDFNFFDEVSI